MRALLLHYITALLVLVTLVQCGESDSITGKTDPEMDKPELVSPEDSSEQSASVTLQWQMTEETESYQVQLSVTDDFSSALADNITDSTVFDIEGLPRDTTVYWKVRAVYQNEYGPWSYIRVFFTRGDSNHPEPLTATLKSPADGSMNQETNITLNWTTIANAAAYNVQLTTDSGFGSLIIDTEVDSTRYHASELSDGETYYWRVEPVIENRATQWSEVFMFSTGIADTIGPDISITADPREASEGDTVTVTASANDSSGIFSIELYVDGSNVETCSNSTSCSHTGSSYDLGSHSYHATAVDASSNANQTQSEVKSFSITANGSSGHTVRIMPLGNSITEAFGYRIPLWNKLTIEGYSVDYVGSQSDPHPELPDTDHEGHGGWYIGHISNNINEWLAAYQPDYVLLMIGTNDIAWWTPRTGAEIAEAHAELVDQILANSSSDTWVLAASIPPQSSKNVEPNDVDRAQLTRDFTRAMKDHMQQRIDDGVHVVFVDVHSRLTVDDLSDGIHPNKQGYDIIAQAWFEALLKVLP